MWNVWHSQRLIFCNSDSRPKRTASNNVKTLLFTLLLSLIYIFAMYYWQYQSHRIITQYTNVWYPCRLLSATCLVLRKELDIRRCSLSTYIALSTFADISLSGGMCLGDQCGARHVGCRPIGFRRQYTAMMTRSRSDISLMSVCRATGKKYRTTRTTDGAVSCCRYVGLSISTNVAEVYPVNWRTTVIIKNFEK